jgi:SAM-dependent MidA family methyltransferase
MPLRDLIIERIRERGPMTFAEYMDAALYEPGLGYYARAARRSGRAGDFFTSVDVGPAFGALLAAQFAEMSALMGGGPIDLVEAGAGDGRLARDVLDAARDEHAEFYASLTLSLVETGAIARAAQAATLAGHADKLVSASGAIPASVRGIIFANELLDALPAHAVVMRPQPQGLREIFVTFQGDHLVEIEGPPSTAAIAAQLDASGARIPVGCRAEVGLRAAEWVRHAARALDSGFLLLIDYGHDATDLYSAAHGAGTIASFRQHRGGGIADALDAPGEHDLTVHVDLDAIRLSAEREDLTTLGILDQTYFLLGLGAADRIGRTPGASVADVKRRLALKTLLLPGGLGSTHKVMIFGRAVGAPRLSGMSFGARLT